MNKTLINSSLRDCKSILKFALTLPKDNAQRGVIIKKMTGEINRLMKLVAQ